LSWANIFASLREAADDFRVNPNFWVPASVLIKNKPVRQPSWWRIVN